MLLLGACNDGAIYLHSVDVDSAEWTSADTLIFPIHVAPLAKPYSPIERNFPYCLTLTVRYERVFPLADVPIRVSLANDIHPVILPLADADGFPDGEQRGTLCQKSVDVNNAVFLFPDSGDYQLKIWPDSTASHILSITATLE